MAIGLHGYLFVGAALFSFGIVGILSRKNAIGILLGIELMLNAAGINFVAFSKYRAAATRRQIDGQVVTLFIILIAAAEAAVALAIILRFYRLKQTIDSDEANF